MGTEVAACGRTQRGRPRKAGAKAARRRQVGHDERKKEEGRGGREKVADMENGPPGGPGGPSCCRAAGMVRVQLTRRWAKIAISSRIDWVGAVCQARSMARFWRWI